MMLRWRSRWSGNGVTSLPTSAHHRLEPQSLKFSQKLTRPIDLHAEKLKTDGGSFNGQTFMEFSLKSPTTQSTRYWVALVNFPLREFFSFLFPIAWEVAFTLHFQYFITLFDLFLPSPQTNGASDIKNQEKTELLLIDDSLNPIGQLPELFNICSCLSLHVWYQILKTRYHQTKHYRWIQEI